MHILYLSQYYINPQVCNYEAIKNRYNHARSFKGSIVNMYSAHLSLSPNQKHNNELLIVWIWYVHSSEAYVQYVILRKSFYAQFIH